MLVNFLEKTVLYKGISQEDIQQSIDFLHVRKKKFDKGEIIFSAGSTIDDLALVLSGSVIIESNDLWGNRTILTKLGRGQYFGETYAILKDAIMLVDVVANEKSEIVFLNVSNLFSDEIKTTALGSTIIANILQISVQKNLHLSRRSFDIAPKTIRGRVMSYLNSMSVQSNKTEFDLPFDRQQMADYLNVERSALSKELGKMRDEGLIDFHKNRFKIFDIDYI
ncbi:MAG: Crp/Fnr family transcriptional regulator [Eubacteriales bacterium]|nr:Crp/Fnr family transcriptional regulator [Eubacteriales bacterium]MDY3332660.1 Crp/Fnr family transcriptional regulator [Gallibacter sp.]